MRAAPRVMGVAIRSDGRVVHAFPPRRHDDLLRRLREDGRPFTGGPDDQGFWLSDLTYVTRAEAYQIAKGNGQLKRRPGAEHYQGDELFSEDLF